MNKKRHTTDQTIEKLHRSAAINQPFYYELTVDCWHTGQRSESWWSENAVDDRSESVTAFLHSVKLLRGGTRLRPNVTNQSVG